MSRHRVTLPPSLVTLLVLHIAVLALFATPALADGPRTTSYQGILTDNAGTALPDGNYALTFRLYTLAAGGTAYWTETHPSVPLVNGGFSVVLGSIAPLTSGFQTQSWLGVQVAADPELAPRVQLAGAPWALDLALPYTGVANTAQAGMSLVNNGSGAALEVQGTVKVRQEGASGTGEVQVSTAAFPTTALKMNANNIGGAVTGYDETGATTFDLSADASSGGGGYLRVFRDGAFANGFLVDGNYAGSGDPLVTIAGDNRSATFNMSIPDNGSVVLPNNAISAVEMLDEPGVAMNGDSTTTSIESGPGLNVLLSASSTVPANGYLFAIATAQVNLFHLGAFATGAKFGLSSNTSVLNGFHDVDLVLPYELPPGTYRLPVTVTGVFPVTAGSEAIFFLAKSLGGELNVEDVTVTTIFIPSAYGMIDPGVQQPISQSGAHESRMQRELDAMRTELESLKRYFAAESGAQPASATPR